MNKKSILSILAFTGILLLTQSCSKKEVTISPYPMLTITTPTQGQSFSSLNAIHITGTATASATDDSHLLHELSLTVKKSADSSVLWTAVISVHDLESYSIDTSFAAPSVTAGTPYFLDALVVNHLLRNAEKTVGFTVNP